MCCLYTDGSTVVIKTEADSNEINELCDDRLSTGMYGFIQCG